MFENLLPDSDALRKRVADKVGAAGYDAYSLLAAIGRDCVGALQFIAGDADMPEDSATISGEPADEEAVERLLKNLAQAPLGLSRDDDFRISVASAQEKTALLRVDGQWFKPHGTTPTTHLFKTQIGQLDEAVDSPPAPSRSQKRRDIPKIVERAIGRQPEEPAIQRARIKRPKLVLLSR